MRPQILILSFALLVAACSTTAPSPTPAPVSSPAASLTGMVWQEFHSEDLVFSLQLPRGWDAARTGTAEGEVMRASAAGEGSLLMTIDIPEEEIPFEQYVRESFSSLLERDPNAVAATTLPAGRAARAVSPREGGGISVIYLFAPRAGHAKSLAFTWDENEPNPVWHAIAERFNAYSPRPLIPFITPSP